MATSPTSKSALLSGAAKDDVVGLNGDYTFTISDLLANDPGGAAKVDVTKQFFFGNSAPVSGGIPSIADQVTYLSNHGITAHVSADGKSFVSFDIGRDAQDINYFVQIGNHGTWSEAHVDVNAPANHAPTAASFTVSATETLSVYNAAHQITNLGADILHDQLAARSKRRGRRYCVDRPRQPQLRRRQHADLGKAGCPRPYAADRPEQPCVRSSGGGPAPVARILSFKLADGHGGEVTNHVTVDMVGTPEAPVAVVRRRRRTAATTAHSLSSGTSSNTRRRVAITSARRKASGT